MVLHAVYIMMLQVIAEHEPGLSLAAVDAMVYAEGVTV
jgi:hypothetical protein